MGSNNTTKNNTTEYHKYRQYKLIGQFTNSNETARISYFEQYLRERAAGNSKRETMARF